MKKIILIFALALSVAAASAQTSANRTNRTIVSDVLALLPAQTMAEYDRLMHDLVTSGPEGLEMLTSMFDSTNNVPVAYALSGWASYVTGPARKYPREIFASGIVEALGRSDDPTIKAFYLTLLQQVGGNESVLALTRLVSDPLLGDPAKGALDEIREQREGFPTVYTPAPKTRLGKLYDQVQGKGPASLPQLLKAATDKDRTYRNEALRYAAPYADQSFYNGLVAALPKAKPEVQTDLITWLGLQKASSALAPILLYIGNADDEVSEAAIWAATRIGGPGVTDRLVQTLGADGTSDEVREAARLALLSTPGSTDAVAAVAKGGSDASKAAALSVLAARRATGNADLVLNATKSGNSAVRKAAYAALKNVVGAGQIPQLYVMLENTNYENLPDVQSAVTSALQPLAPADRLAAVQGRMANSAGDKTRYYAILSATGDPAALEVLNKSYWDGGTYEAQRAAVQALLAWDGPESAPYLYAIAETDDAFSADALDGFVRVVSASDKTPEMKQIMLTEALEIADKTDATAQKSAILFAMGRTLTFQALVTAGRYVNDSDAAVRRQAVDAVYHVVNNGGFHGPVVRDLAEKAMAAYAGDPSDYGRESVLSTLSEMSTEGGFVSMFNGRDLTGWKGLVENPIARSQMSRAELADKQRAADEIMRRDWSVIDGLLEFHGDGFDNICSEKEYGDFELFMDWLLYPDPEGDSGVYLRGTPQVQIWNTERPGADIGSGGLYNNNVYPSAPSVNADNETGKWNTFYIKMVGDRVTVVLNGIKVVDNVVLENYWDRNLPVFPMGEIELQAHTTPLAFRNIYINELTRPEPFRLSAAEEADGFRILFDGTNMHEWQGNLIDYVIEDGEMVVDPENGGKGNLFTKKEYDNFIFRFEFKLTPAANNGLGIRTPMEGDAAYVGMELQILDNTAPVYSQLEDYQYHASVYGIIPAKRGALNPLGEWNYQEVIADGDNIKVTLNGQVIVDGNLSEAMRNGAVDGKDHPGARNKTGYIGFLGHGSKLWFRNIRVKEL